MIGFTILGIIAACAGVVIVVNGFRAGLATPRGTAMLIGGMMLTAFGIVIAGFAIVYQRTAPLEMNSVVPQ